MAARAVTASPTGPDLTDQLKAGRRYDIGIKVEADLWEQEWPNAQAISLSAAQAALSYLADRSLPDACLADRLSARSRERTIELSLVLANDALIRELNTAYRDENSATNVLAFPLHDANVADGGLKDDGPERVILVGDVVMAYETVVREAIEQGKHRDAHLAHLVTHGVLHLFGFDHQDAVQSEEMIVAETAILAGLGIDDPYALPDGQSRL